MPTTSIDLGDNLCENVGGISVIADGISEMLTEFSKILAEFFTVKLSNFFDFHLLSQLWNYQWLTSSSDCALQNIKNEGISSVRTIRTILLYVQ